MALAGTQKALGILQGIPHLLQGTTKFRTYVDAPDHRLVRSAADVDKTFSYHNYTVYPPSLPMFARPCPKRPRHGFIESRTVRTVEEIKKLMNKVLKEDPEGELLLGSHYENVISNAVCVSSGLLSVGPGNDGATGGKDSVSFPIAQFADETLKKKSKIRKNDALYIEAILPEHHSQWTLTQVRGGPNLSVGSEDFIPFNLVVKQVIVPCEDLLEWEKKVKKIGKGTVVYGNGHTLASHAAVHCVLHDIPFVVSHLPKVGEKLTVTENGKHNRKMKRNQFRRGAYLAFSRLFPRREAYRDNFGDMFRFCFAVLHNWARLKESPHADWLLGVAVTMFAKLCAALVLGEYRHYDGDIRNHEGRIGVYRNVMTHTRKYVPLLHKAFKHFYTKHWNSGFGGMPWANCAWYTIEMWRSIISAYNSKATHMSSKDVARLMDIMNRTINQAHNNGWWFNKIATQEDMTFAAKHPALMALSVADIFYYSAREVEKVKVKSGLGINQLKHRVRAPCGLNKNNKLVWAYMEMDSYEAESYRRSTRKGKINVYTQIYEEGRGRRTKVLRMTRRKIGECCKYRLNDAGKVFFNVVPKVGFRIPNGNIICYKGIQPT